MKRLILIAGLVLSEISHAGCLTAPDNPGGAKAHFGFGAAAGALTALVLPDASLLTQFSVAMIPSVAKEIMDCRSSGLASRHDLLVDSLGVGLGMLGGNVTVHLYRHGIGVSVAVPLGVK